MQSALYVEAGVSFLLVVVVVANEVELLIGRWEAYLKDYVWWRLLALNKFMGGTDLIFVNFYDRIVSRNS